MLSTTDKILFLRRSSLFAEMSLEQIRVLTSHLEEQHFLPGEVIMYEGEFSQELYILVSGRVRIAKDYGGPHEQTLALLAPFLLLYLPVFLVQLRRRERQDPEVVPRPTADHVRQLAELEDHDITNQFTGLLTGQQHGDAPLLARRAPFSG